MVSKDSSDYLLDELASAFAIFIVIVSITFFGDFEIFSECIKRMVMRGTAFFDSAVMRSMFVSMPVVLVAGRSQCLVIGSEQCLSRSERAHAIVSYLLAKPQLETGVADLRHAHLDRRGIP